MPSHEFTTRDVEYLRHGDRRMMARLYVPQGKGPFPAIVELHGGAWCNGDLNECNTYAEAFARAGLAVAAIDFRHAADGYPTSLADINYAIRWVKANAGELNTRADLIGAAGQSSGGHLAMLAAMRPNDPRYAAIKLPAGAPSVDASAAGGRHAMAGDQPAVALPPRAAGARQRQSAGLGGQHPAAATTPYWKTEAAMAEGNPMLALENGEKVQTPPALWLQGRPDPVHDYHDPDSAFSGTEPERFTANYRKAGGNIDLMIVEQADRTTAATLGKVADFFHQHIKVNG